MAAPKGHNGQGGGRPKGSLNKINQTLKEMILGALDEAGGQAYLVKQANANPVAFMTLVGKVLPLSLANDPNNPLTPALTQADRDIIERFRQQIRQGEAHDGADCSTGAEKQIAVIGTGQGHV